MISDRRKAVSKLPAEWSDEHRSLARSSKRVVVVGLLFWLFPAAVTCGAAKPAQGITVIKPSPQAGSETRLADVRELQQGQTIEREMTGGATHTYRIAMTQGQYLHVVVEQKALDVVVRLYGPEGKKLIEVDSPNGTQGPEPPNRQTLSNYLLNARALYQELIQPAARILAGKKSLIIVADGILNYLPFEALLESDSGRSAQLDLSRLPYLVRDYAISYAPSATVLAS